MSSKIELKQSGFFGKIPALGDFVCSGLPSSFTKPWDDWLQALILQINAHNKEQSQTELLRLSPFHFALSPGLCGEPAWIGVCIPSSDKADREFPLTFACTSLLPENAIHCLLENSAALKQIEYLLTQSSNNQIDKPSLEQSLNTLSNKLQFQEPLQDKQFVDAQSQDINSDSLGLTISMAENSEPHWNDIAESLMMEACGSYSFWRSYTPNKMFLCEGIPAPEEIIALLDNTQEQSLDDTTPIDEYEDDMDATIEAPIYTDDDTAKTESVKPVLVTQETGKTEKDTEFPWE